MGVLLHQADTNRLKKTGAWQIGIWMFESALRKTVMLVWQKVLAPALLQRVSPAKASSAGVGDAVGGPHQADFDLTPLILATFFKLVNRERENASSITVGEQKQSSYLNEDTSASSSLCLPGDLWSCFSKEDWPVLTALDMRDQQCIQACTQAL